MLTLAFDTSLSLFVSVSLSLSPLLPLPLSGFSTHYHVDYAGIFEIHVTASGGPGAECFGAICADLRVKTNLIELNSTAVTRLPDQLMTASHHTGSCLFDVQRLAYDIAQRFLAAGYRGGTV